MGGEATRDAWVTFSGEANTLLILFVAQQKPSDGGLWHPILMQFYSGPLMHLLSGLDKRKHVTLTMLWDEYIERCPEGYRYSRFCELYRSWASRLSVTMRQAHTGGDKLFVDYAGDTVPVIIDRLTGQVRPAQIFVAVTGA